MQQVVMLEDHAYAPGGWMGEGKNVMQSFSRWNIKYGDSKKCCRSNVLGRSEDVVGIAQRRLKDGLLSQGQCTDAGEGDEQNHCVKRETARQQSLKFSIYRTNDLKY